MKTRSSNPVERFTEVLFHEHLPPATKAKTLTAIAYSMNLQQIAEARNVIREYYGKRLKHLEEIGAPEVILEGDRRILARHNAYLDRAEKRLLEKEE